MDNKYYKPRRPYDYLPDDPSRAVEESWDDTCASTVTEEMTNWFYITLVDKESIYEGFELRARFIEFYVDLLPFIEATYFYNLRRERVDISKYESLYLKREEVNDPMIIIRQFCDKYPLHYVRVELWDWHETVQFYDGPLKERIDRQDTGNFHMLLLTLVEGFYLIVGVKPS